MLICDMCKSEIDSEKNKVEIWLQGGYRDKIRKLGFSHKPELCSLACAIRYLSEFAALIKEPLVRIEQQGS